MTCSYENTVSTIPSAKAMGKSLWYPRTTAASVTEDPSMVGGSLIMTVFGMQWRKSERADYFLELEVPKRNKIRTRSSHCGYDF